MRFSCEVSPKTSSSFFGDTIQWNRPDARQYFLSPKLSLSIVRVFSLCVPRSRGDRGDLLGASGDMDGPRGLYSKLASWFAC